MNADILPQKTSKVLEKIASLKDVQIAKGTLNLYLMGVRLQFLHYPYRLLKSTINWQGVNLSSLTDIAYTKLQTISARGYKKDFIDLCVILKKHSLKNLLAHMKKSIPELTIISPIF